MKKAFSLYKIFEDTDLTEQQIAQMSDQFLVICFLNLLQKTDPNFNDNERQQVKDFFAEQSYEDALDIIQAKYTKNEWRTLVKSTIDATLKDYMKSIKK